MQIIRLLFPTIMIIIITFTSLLNADNNAINGACPGETIEEINGVKTTTSYTENGGIGGKGNDRYQMNFPVEGTLSINITNTDANKNANYNFYLSNTTCGNWNLINEEYGNSHSATVNVNAGDTVWVRMQSIANEPNKGRHRYALALTFTPTSISQISPGNRDFTLRYRKAFAGNMVTIGNTILVAPQDQSANICSTYTNGTYINDATQSNSSYKLCEYHVDANQPFGTTKAKLTLPAGNTKIAWAGLYWQAVDTHPANLKNMKIKIKHESDSAYTKIDFDHVDFGENVGEPGYDSYSAFKDVTKLFQDNHWLSGDIIVGDIPVFEGKIPHLGSYGAWCLVVIYENDTESIKQFNIYDGWKRIDKDNNVETIKINGFKTPRSVPIEASASVFVAEGDKRIAGDTVNVKPSKRNNFEELATFSSLVNTTPKFTRTPSPINNQGIDIHSFNLGTTGLNIIEPEESEMSFKFTSVDDPGVGQDRYWPSMISFAAELLVPKICYDYNVRKNGVTLRAEDRNISTVGAGELAVNVSIRSMEGDFDLDLSTLKLRLTPTNDALFTEAKYSPNTVNTLIPAVPSSSTTPEAPEIGIGSNVGTGATTNGGTISRFERYFTQFKYTLTKDTFNGHFDVNLNTSIDFGSGATPYTFSTSGGTLPRCEQSEVYHPQWGRFNIERLDSKNFDPVSQPNKRFPLYTQVAGRDFDFSLVAYDAKAVPSYSQELDVSGITVDVELIDASPYNDQDALFKCSNTDTSVIQKLPNGETSFFVHFPKKTSRIDLTKSKAVNVATDTALRNAAFRMWLLVDANNTIIKHQCDKRSNNQCFEKVYKKYLEAGDTNQYCNKCSNYSGGCYQCLRDHFATPICSRDNFSIRPAAYRIKISDNNESNASTKPEISLGINDSTNTVATIAAGYLYKIDANATLFATDQFAKGYNRDFTTPSSSNLLAQYQFDSKSGASCADTNASDLGLRFENGYIQGTFNGKQVALRSNNLHSHSNVGRYNLHIEDQNWTIVDQKRYVNKEGKPLKTFPKVDDCISTQNSISVDGNSQSGCTISSKLPTGSPGRVYEDLNIRFEPYSFGLSSVTLKMDPNNNANYLFMNDFSSALYKDTTRRRPTMSALFKGGVSALAKGDTVTSNFTAGCVAHNVNLSVGRIMNPTENGLQDSKGNTVPFQLALQESNSTIAPMKVVSGLDKNVTLSRSAFIDTLKGQANMRLHTTIKKPTNATINPIDVNYTDLRALSVASSSSAGMTTHIPEGNNTYTQDITFYLAKVTPMKKLYPNIIKNTVKTPISVDIYCDYTDGRCANDYNLTLPSKGQNADMGWLAATMFNPLADGTTNLSAIGGSVTPNNNVLFDDQEGTQNDINVTLSTSTTRPATVDTTICPVPWLRYDPSDPNGCPHYKSRFIGNSGWSGVGNVGRASKAESNRNPGPSRTSW